MPDLFDYTPPPKYPDSPGSKEPTTSAAAARLMAPKVLTLRQQVLTALQVAWPAGLTADEAAARIGRSEFSIRPRLSELRATGDIMPANIVRPNASGVNAMVWVCKRPEESDQ